jgi:hypothetical protein
MFEHILIASYDSNELVAQNFHDFLLSCAPVRLLEAMSKDNHFFCGPEVGDFVRNCMEESDRSASKKKKKKRNNHLLV